eukprot:scaffold32037_cov66-Phaeocystis_antarctica.AAC.4
MAPTGGVDVPTSVGNRLVGAARQVVGHVAKAAVHEGGVARHPCPRTARSWTRGLRQRSQQPSGRLCTPCGSHRSRPSYRGRSRSGRRSAGCLRPRRPGEWRSRSRTSRVPAGWAARRRHVLWLGGDAVVRAAEPPSAQHHLPVIVVNAHLPCAVVSALARGQVALAVDHAVDPLNVEAAMHVCGAHQRAMVVVEVARLLLEGGLGSGPPCTTQGAR